ncbi:50S ribosomal protein L20 [mine drainage metagenome]|uniref:50S ribosomal protein L20 n=1 Tax=mine drainage metagenome TaxID=410659 RepID=A0A1J5P202_9ZZZZ
MGTYAASGGYWISSEASAIVAEPTTLTGSIGVYGGKFDLGPALAKFGVDVRQTTVGGDYAGAFGMGREFTPADRAAFAGWMDRIYANFVARVAAGRKLSPDRVRQIAKGRVWTGAQARQLGLVDEIGGFYQAVDKANQYATRDRKTRKRNFRALWIQRINAGCRAIDPTLTYSRFINALTVTGIEVDRKVLADLAVNEPEAFGAIVAKAQAALAA